MSSLNEAVDAFERVLCARYNVASVEGLGPFPEALSAARNGNTVPLEDAMAGREMYHWAEQSDAALAAIRSRGEAVTPAAPEPPAPEGEESDDGKPLARMNKAELLSLAAERGIEVNQNATNPELREALER